MNEKLKKLNQQLAKSEARSCGGHSTKKRYWNTR